MPDLLPQATSRWSNWVGIIGLDLSPYRWWLVGDGGRERRGEFTVDHLTRGGDLTIGETTYRMKRRQSGLRETTFTLMAASGQPLASGALFHRMRPPNRRSPPGSAKLTPGSRRNTMPAWSPSSTTHTGRFRFPSIWSRLRSSAQTIRSAIPSTRAGS